MGCGGGGSVTATGFSRPGGSHSSPPSAHPLLPPAPHALNSPRACLSLTARAKYLAEQAPAVLSPLCLLPIFPGGSADIARDGERPEPTVWWTVGEKKGQERPVSVLTTLSPVPGPGHGRQGRLLKASQSVWVATAYIPTAFPTSQEALPGVSYSPEPMKEHLPAPTPTPPQVVAQDRAEGIRRL